MLDELIDAVIQRAMGDDGLRTKIAETVDVMGLREHEGWQALQRHWENGTRSQMTGVASRLFAGEDVSQREVDFIRGGMLMAAAIFAYPERAVSNLEHTAQRLYAEHLREQRKPPASEYIDQEVTSE